ncbi:MULTISPECIES: protoglobin domain-containing protein [Sorangium]|uniref:histidine kinase n=1 Tax=Sorangium cellulosum (strain So ce56) TaxID=448385 RepID=A9GCE3_SORC5|nr:protoglobin domain-containing protein [Sorangium cellulosum]CAN96176.1 two-component sensor histidine kinase [Sorangium cellulosum So ce56]
MVDTVIVPAQETLFDEIKRYVRFSEQDERWLAVLRAHAEPHFPRIADEFYDRIREHEGAHDVFTGEEQVERLKRSLVRWMTRICTGPYDGAYFDESAKIGRIHVRVGLPQRYMFTAMTLIRLAFHEIAQGALGAEVIPVRAAVSKVLDLELAIMLETYRDDFLARAQRTERLDREEVGRTLARTEHRYKSAVELARVLVVGLDAQAIVRLFNREAERITGLAREDVLGVPFVEALLPEEIRADHGALVEDVAAGRRPSVDLLESIVRTRAGKIRDLRWQLAYAPSAADDEVVLFAIGQDTTDENALAARVRQSEKLAAVGTLAAGLAHEIRNPLNGAQLHVTFLERGLARAGLKDPDTLEAIQVVRDEIRRLSALVSEFLDFARPKPLDLRPTPVVPLCERAARVAASSDGAGAQAAVKVDLPSTDIMLDLDPAKIEQVLLNLLRNAIEAVDAAGGGTVTLRARRQPRHAVVEVEDDGPGIASPDAPIFDPFFSTKPNGTGLGLAIAHRIVTDHEGTIEFQSRPGKTLFRVTLPLRRSG